MVASIIIGSALNNIQSYYINLSTLRACLSHSRPQQQNLFSDLQKFTL